LNDPQETKDKRIRGGCTAGVAACVVDPSGNVFPCPFLREKAGNIYEQSLSKIWTNSKLFKKLRDRDTFSRSCRNCSLLYFCGGCRNRALKHTGKITGADPLCYKKLKLN
jgi:radical SAM protein with 4Fe4S-binding SPASM domain